MSRGGEESIADRQARGGKDHHCAGRPELTESGGRGLLHPEEIREEGQRVGFQLCELGGKEGLLAHASLASPDRVGRYGVQIETMEEIALPALRKAIAGKDLVVIDEIGRMELFCPAFLEAILLALESPKPVLGVLQERASPLSQRIKRRQDTKIIPVTLENRDQLVEVILQELEGHLDIPGESGG